MQLMAHSQKTPMIFSYNLSMHFNSLAKTSLKNQATKTRYFSPLTSSVSLSALPAKMK